MKIQDTLSDSFFEVYYIIYEKDDSAILLNGAYVINNKKYYTDIPLEPLKFSHLCERSIGMNKTNLIWNRLMNNNDLVAEVSPLKHVNELLSFRSIDIGLDQKYTLKSA